MTLAPKKIRSADRAKIIIYVGDKQDPKGNDYPIFISVARNILTELGGVKKFNAVPGTTYTSKAGLTYKIFRDADGLLWKETKGQKKGTNYSDTTLVTVGKYKNALTLYLKKTEVKRIAGTTQTAPTTKQVRLFFPNVANGALVQAFIAKYDLKELIVGQKFNGTLFTWGTILKSVRGTPASKKEPQVLLRSIMGVVTRGKANTDGSLNKSKGSSDRQMVIASFTEKAAQAFGFEKIELSNDTSEKIVSTPIGALVADKRFVGYDVVKTPRLYNSVWSNDDPPQNITDAGTGVTVKVRFEYINTGSSAISSGRYNKASTYVKFQCPAGTSVGMIGKYIVSLKRYGVSFQISNDGKNYGTSYPLPSKPANRLKRVETTARAAGKVRNRRRNRKAA